MESRETNNDCSLDLSPNPERNQKRNQVQQNQRMIRRKKMAVMPAAEAPSEPLIVDLDDIPPSLHDVSSDDEVERRYDDDEIEGPSTIRGSSLRRLPART